MCMVLSWRLRSRESERLSSCKSHTRNHMVHSSRTRCMKSAPACTFEPTIAYCADCQSFPDCHACVVGGLGVGYFFDRDPRVCS